MAEAWTPGSTNAARAPAGRMMRGVFDSSVSSLASTPTDSPGRVMLKRTHCALNLAPAASKANVEGWLVRSGCRSSASGALGGTEPMPPELSRSKMVLS
jgi:hypothetical protein